MFKLKIRSTSLKAVRRKSLNVDRVFLILYAWWWVGDGPLHSAVRV